jgi:hypothetical protein
MALAMIYPEPEKGGRGQKGVRDGQVSHQRLSLARTVLSQKFSLYYPSKRILLKTTNTIGVVHVVVNWR